MSFVVSQKLLGRILVVEDDHMIGTALVRNLNKFGFSCTLARSFDEAMGFFMKESFHAVVTDVFLDNEKNERDGLRIVREVSKLGVPVLVITSSADLEIAKTSLNEGASYLFEKPFKAEDLAVVLQNIWEDPKGLTNLAERFLDLHLLTAKEKEVAKMLLKGLSNLEISKICNNTEKTVKFHITNIFAKSSVKSRAEFFNSIFPT